MIFETSKCTFPPASSLWLGHFCELQVELSWSFWDFASFKAQLCSVAFGNQFNDVENVQYFVINKERKVKIHFSGIQEQYITESIIKPDQVYIFVTSTALSESGYA